MNYCIGQGGGEIPGFRHWVLVLEGGPLAQAQEKGRGWAEMQSSEYSNLSGGSVLQEVSNKGLELRSTSKGGLEFRNFQPKEVSRRGDPQRGEVAHPWVQRDKIRPRKVKMKKWANTIRSENWDNRINGGIVISHADRVQTGIEVNERKTRGLSVASDACD